MRPSLLSPHLLVFISVLSLNRAQTTTETTTESTTETTITTETSTAAIATTPWTAPAIFYPYGSANGDTEIIVPGSEIFTNVVFSTPFAFFGRGYNSVYINNNGLLTFNQPLPEAHPSPFPTYGSEDYIAALWTELDDFGYGQYWYQEYTSGSVLDRATQDINQYFPNMGFTVSWVFVVTWDYVLTGDMNGYINHLGPAITFQAVLIGGYGFSFILMNYADCAGMQFPVEAGYDTVGSTDYHVIHYDPYSAYNIPTLKNTTNVDVPGRWAFLVNNGTDITMVTPTTTPVTTTTTTTTPTPWTAPAIFYPFGLAAGDTVQFESGGDTYVNVAFSTPFTYFGRKYNSVYINNNGLLTFNQPLPEAHPYPFPTHGYEDYIAALWTELDDVGFGTYSYQEYTSGSVLSLAAQHINQCFPNMGFTASWVFVVTWDYVLTWDMNVFNHHSGPAITFQAVLIGGHGFSFILMNYGDCAGMQFPVEAGYDTVGSTDYDVIHYDASGGYGIPGLKDTTNVGVPGRWAFLVNNGTAIFYPFGSAAGDVGSIEADTETAIIVAFSTPYTFFGRPYNSIWINNIGLLTFNQPVVEGYPPYAFPTYGSEDYIAPLWSDFDDLGYGTYWHQEYTSGSVLDRATKDVHKYFHNMGFTASWVFVVTWDYVLTWDLNVFHRHEGPAITFQAVLISDAGNSSYILMNYGECAQIYFAGQAGYDTIGSTNYYVIHYDPSSGYSFADMKNTTNVGVPGRWAFSVNNGTETVLGVQMKVTSFDDLMQSGNIEDVLQKMKNVLVSRGVSSNFGVKLRKVQKINP